MLKRNNLAKQFELVVQQEIINHNEAVLATNLAINDLRNQNESNSQKQCEINSSFSSHITTINSNNLKLSDLLLKSNAKLDSFINDSRTLNERNYKQYQEVAEALDRSFKENERLKKEISSIAIDNVNLADNLSRLKKILSNEIEDVKREIKAHSNKIKEEILNLPSEAQIVKKELEEKLCIASIDNAGLTREIEALKKKVFINEKKFEYLDTLIERLDKRIS